MTDYISREAVLREIRECFNNNGWYGNSRVELLNAIASLPGREDKDGERYRAWRDLTVRDNNGDVTSAESDAILKVLDARTYYDFDAAIDAAMQEAKP